MKVGAEARDAALREIAEFGELQAALEDRDAAQEELRKCQQDAIQLQARLAEAEQENARLVAANKARDEFLRGHRYKHSGVDGYINLCESQIADLKARLAEAEAGRDFLFASRDTERSTAALVIEELGARLVKAEALLLEAREDYARAMNEAQIAADVGCNLTELGVKMSMWINKIARIDAHLARKP